MRRFALLLVLPILAACVATTEPPPDSGVSAVPRWLSVRGVVPAWPAADWWRGFHDPELERVIAAVQAGNPDLAIAGQRLLQARARARASAAGLLPTVDFSAVQLAQTQGALRTESYGLGFVAAYELDLWGRNRAIADSALSAAEASRYDREAVAITVVADAAIAYFRVLSLRERIALARRNLATGERILGFVATRVAEGGGLQSDLAQQRAQVLGQRAQLPALQQLELVERAELAERMGQPLQALTVRGQGIPGGRLAPVRPGLPSSLIARRPDIRRAEAELASAGADVTAARAALLPTVSLTGVASLRSAALAALLNSSSVLASVGSSLVQSVFDGGRRAAELDSAVSRRTEQLVRYQSAVRAALSDVDLALSALQRLAEQEGLQRGQVAELRRALGLAEERYRAGSDDLQRLLEVQRSLIAAEDQLVQTRSLRVQAHVALIRALGGGWSDEVRPQQAPTPQVRADAARARDAAL